MGLVAGAYDLALDVPLFGHTKWITDVVGIERPRLVASLLLALMIGLEWLLR